MTGKLTMLDLSVAPESATSSPKRVLWKWSLAVTGLILLCSNLDVSPLDLSLLA
jgi:hypothetical protein